MAAWRDAMGRWFERLEEGLLAFLLAAMTIITFCQVIARYVFNYSFVWALEFVTFLFAWLIFVGMCYGVRVGAHIGMDSLVKTLGLRAARIATGVAAALSLVYAGIVFAGSWRYVAKMHEIGILAQDIPIPLWIPRFALPLGFGLLAIRFAQVLYRIIVGKETSLLGDEARDALKHRVEEEAPPPRAGA